jgi:protein-S-isoprenylcysteine O-methyltransferase Ste14
MDTQSEMNHQQVRSLTATIIIRFSLMFAFLGLIILLPAGTFEYWQFYVYLGIIVVLMVLVLRYFLKTDPKFLERRMRLKEKESQQKVIQAMFSLFFFSVFIISGLDRRYGWSVVPASIVVLADFFVLVGYSMIILVFKQNS